MIKIFILLFILFLSKVGLSANFDQFDQLVHIIKIKSSDDSSNSNRGTGFVVGKNGRVITNFHVISKLFKKGKMNKDYKVYIKVDKKEYQAKVIKFDIMTDLALLEIPYKFKSIVTISNDLAPKGSKVYSLGFHDKEFLAINQGLLSDYLKDDSNKLMALSIALNAGMSGGPILNTSLEVIGVNVLKSTRKESSGYGINGDKLKSFLKNIEKVNDSLEDVLGKQINITYRDVMTSINESNEQGTLSGWETPELEKFLFCGEYDSHKNLDKDIDDKNKNEIKAMYKICKMDHRKVPLSALGTHLKIRFGIVNFKASENTNEVTYYNYINKSFQIKGLVNMFNDDEFSCQKNYFKNKHETTFKVSVCAFKYEKVPGYIKNEDFYKFNIKAVTVNDKMDDIYVNLQFSGGAGLAKTIIKNVLGNIYRSH